MKRLFATSDTISIFVNEIFAYKQMRHSLITSDIISLFTNETLLKSNETF